MVERVSRLLLSIILVAGVIVGAYFGLTRYFLELQDNSVELCVDLADIKLMAARENKPLGEVLNALSTLQVTSLGVAEQTLADANADGDIYYAKGSGLLIQAQVGPFHARLDNIEPDLVYIFAPNAASRKRIYHHLANAIGEEKVRFKGNDILIVNEAEESLRTIGLGISEQTGTMAEQAGFRVIPRVWQDQHIDSRKMSAKFSSLKDYGLIIFEGEELLGFPEHLPALATALKENELKYGYVEIVNQLGNNRLKRLMGASIVRIHGISSDELKKVPATEAVPRIIRAVKERKIQLVYLRPYLLPDSTIASNLNYFQQVSDSLRKAGFVLTKTGSAPALGVKPWQAVMLGLSVVITALSLFGKFVPLPQIASWLTIVTAALTILFAAQTGHLLLAQKLLALLAAVTFPAWAVISTFSQSKKIIYTLWEATMLVLNIVAESLVGVVLLVGLLADTRLLQGVEVFFGVKIALVLPLFLVAAYFLLEQTGGTLRQKINVVLNMQIKVAGLLAGLVGLGLLGVLIARSGNFIIPVPGLEKWFREFLETALSVRPRTKELLIGYPFLFFAATYFLRGKRQSLWLLAAIGAIAPISILNTFSHIHIPLAISLTRTVNGLALGILLGMIVSLLGAIRMSNDQ